MREGKPAYGILFHMEHKHTWFIDTSRAYLQYSKKKIIRKSYIKNEVFKYMLSKLAKYNLNKKLQIYLVGQPWALQFTQHFFRNRCILPTEDEMNLFTIVTV